MKKYPLAFAATVLLAACGGGTEDPPSPPPTSSPDSAVHGLRAVLSGERIQAVTPEDSAEHLMNYAQTSIYAFYFPGNPPTRSFPPFRYRAYFNGVLLGVVVRPGMGYRMEGVYVMGGPFGSQPTYVGQLTDFIGTVH